MPSTDKPAINTLNKYFVAASAREVRILAPAPRVLSAHDAMVFAAYLVSVAESLPGAPAFADVLSAVQNA